MANRPPLDSPTPSAEYESDAEPTRTSRRELLRGAAGVAARASIPLTTSSTPERSNATTTLDAWKALERNLTVALADLDEDEYIMISSKRANHFVQFAAQGAYGMRAEAVSNAYLDVGDALSPQACRQPAALRWHQPTSGAGDDGKDSPADFDGSSNYFLDAPPPVPFADLARLGLATLREVYRLGHPGHLTYDAGSVEDADVSLRFPALGLKRTKVNS